MEYTVPSWINTAKRIEVEDESKAVEFIYSKINADQINGDYEASYLRTLDVDSLSPMLIGAILTITYSERNYYEFREEFYQRCLDSIKERHPEELDILDGLNN
jgi:hypothetical protein